MWVQSRQARVLHRQRCEMEQRGYLRWVNLGSRANSFVRKLGLLAFFALCWGIITPAYASDARLCADHFRNKRWEQAARCFRDVARPLEAKKKLLVHEQSRLFTLLRNAALCWRKAAESASSEVDASYLREKGVLVLQHILKNNYYENSSQKRLAMILKEREVERVRYIRVLVSTLAKKAKVVVSGGYRFKTLVRRQADVRFLLRPGTYSVVVTYPSQPPQMQTVVLRARKRTVVLSFRPHKNVSKPRDITVPSVPPKRRSSSTGWTVFGVGAGAVAVAGVLLGSAVAMKLNNDKAIQSLKDAYQQEPASVSVEDTREAIRGQENANLLLGVSSVLGGAGVTAAVLGLVVALQSSKTQKNSSVSPSQTQVSFLPRDFLVSSSDNW